MDRPLSLVALPCRTSDRNADGAQGTLAAVLRHVPDVTVLWLDARCDFNTPDATPSGFLGGMCLAAGCGEWEAGFDGPRVEPARVVMCGVRDLDLDVLDPSVLPAQFAAPGGLSDGGLRTLLGEVAEAAELVGCEITAFAEPDRARRVPTIVEPLLPESSA